MPGEQSPSAEYLPRLIVNAFESQVCIDGLRDLIARFPQGPQTVYQEQPEKGLILKNAVRILPATAEDGTLSVAWRADINLDTSTRSARSAFTTINDDLAAAKGNLGNNVFAVRTGAQHRLPLRAQGNNFMVHFNSNDGVLILASDMQSSVKGAAGPEYLFAEPLKSIDQVKLAVGFAASFLLLQKTVRNSEKRWLANRIFAKGRYSNLPGIESRRLLPQRFTFGSSFSPVRYVGSQRRNNKMPIALAPEESSITRVSSARASRQPTKLVAKKVQLNKLDDKQPTSRPTRAKKATDKNETTEGLAATQPAPKKMPAKKAASKKAAPAKRTPPKKQVPLDTSPTDSASEDTRVKPAPLAGKPRARRQKKVDPFKSILAQKPEDLDLPPLVTNEVEKPAIKHKKPVDVFRTSGETQPYDPSNYIKRSFEVVTPKYTLDDIGGHEELKQQIREIALSYNHPEILARYKLASTSGVLFHGPPGTGKTMLAHALASETNSALWIVKSAQLYDMWLSLSDKNMQYLFDTVAAYKDRLVLLFDEIDSIVSIQDASGPGGASNERNQVAGSFKRYLNDLSETSPHVIIVGTTNNLDSIDQSLIRSGRFNKILPVPPPDEEGRIKIITAMIMSGMNLGFELYGKDINVPELARKTPSFNGADLREIINATILDKALNEAKTGRQEQIMQADLEYQIDRFNRPS
ncbi:MAG: family ATPase [Candidatus Saccharibacteria bacterium]|nr:family ATPase [Candidatus Saccharibacteria bacterium]